MVNRPALLDVVVSPECVHRKARPDLPGFAIYSLWLRRTILNGRGAPDGTNLGAGSKQSKYSRDHCDCAPIRYGLNPYPVLRRQLKTD